MEIRFGALELRLAQPSTPDSHPKASQAPKNSRSCLHFSIPIFSESSLPLVADVLTLCLHSGYWTYLSLLVPMPQILGVLS